MSEIEKVTPAQKRPSTARKAPAQKPASKIPAGVAKPRDHAPAKNDVVAPGPVPIEWREDPETKEPFVYMIDPDSFDDLDYVDALISMETATSKEEGTTYAYLALKALLGPELMELWKQRERLTQGRAGFGASIQFFNSLMEQLKKGK